MEGGVGTLRRRRLGRELRSLRERAGLTGEDVAGRLERSGSWISRVETGRIALRVRDLQDLFEIYGVSDQSVRTALEELAREGKQRGWWSRYGDAVPEPYAMYIGLEEVATSILMYTNTVMPGLVQIEAYAIGLHRVGIPPDPAQLTADKVAVRMRRQRILDREQPPTLEIILDEAVLYRAYGGSIVLHDQLERLAEQVRAGKFTLRVVPFAHADSAALVTSYTVLGFGRDPDVVYVETATGGTVHDGAEVATYHTITTHLQAAALDPATSLAAVERARDNSDHRTR